MAILHSPVHEINAWALGCPRRSCRRPRLPIFHQREDKPIPGSSNHLAILGIANFETCVLTYHATVGEEVKPIDVADDADAESNTGANEAEAEPNGAAAEMALVATMSQAINKVDRRLAGHRDSRARRKIFSASRL